MKIRMLVCMVGPDFVRDIDQELDLADANAKSLIEAGYAEPVKTQREKPTPPKVERAVKP